MRTEQRKCSTAGCVEVWTPDATFPAIEWATVTWRPTGVAEGFELGLAELFRPI